MPEPILESLAVGPLPLINHFLRRLRLDELLEDAVQDRDRRRKLPIPRALGVFVRNLLLSRYPLYEIPQWTKGYVPELLGLAPAEMRLLNDDRIGRCLDRLFAVDRAQLLTALVVGMTREFDMDLKILHNDSTTITFTGQYPHRGGGEASPLHITYGHNKDHRPDLKQLLFDLTVTEDGSVPVWVGLHDGNVTDDQTHLDTWTALRQIVGRPDFVYVADSKLCVTETLTSITGQGGHFVTVLPRTRKEERWFKEHVQTHTLPWEEVWRRPPARRQEDPAEVYQAVESPLRSAEGFRILWYHSSVKHSHDQHVRQSRIERAVAELEFLRNRLGTRKWKQPRVVEDAAVKILETLGAERWIEVRVEPGEEVQFRQAGPGRPGKTTAYRRVSHPKPKLHWTIREDTVAYDAKIDGLFPLLTDLDKATPKQVLLWYKHQPRLEKRFEQLKTVLGVRPVYLKKVERVEAYLLLYFVALVVAALIERDLRRAMKQQHVPMLPLYPEKRDCQAPTAERVLELFANLRRHRLLQEGKEVHRFRDELSRTQRQVLRLLGVPTDSFLT